MILWYRLFGLSRRVDLLLRNIVCTSHWNYRKGFTGVFKDIISKTCVSPIPPCCRPSLCPAGRAVSVGRTGWERLASIMVVSRFKGVRRFSVLVLPLIHCVTLGKLLHPSLLSSLSYKMEIMTVSTLQVTLKMSWTTPCKVLKTLLGCYLVLRKLPFFYYCCYSFQ